jgi:magnesium transporter
VGNAVISNLIFNMTFINRSRPFTLFGDFSGTPGSVPGSLEDPELKKDEPIRINVYDYSKDYKEFDTVESIEKCKPYLQKPTNTWIQVQGLGEIEKLKSIWNHFELHPLIQEDIINPVQRPKVELYENCIFIVMRSLRYSAGDEIKSEQISFVLGKDYLLSFQETRQPIFESVIKRLRASAGRIPTAGIDYLAYALLDNVTDHYFAFLDDLNEKLGQIEEDLMAQEGEETRKQIHAVRKDIIFANKSIWPARDMLSLLIREETELIDETTKIYLRDVYDHMAQIIINLENFRETSISLYDMYMSDINNQTNEIMKVLTMIATIFIPLTFIAGVYGMNFNPEKSPFNMPELNWYWGYIGCLAVMLVVAVIMIIYFRRKGWL